MKRGVLLFVLTLVSFPLVHGATLTQTLQNVWSRILYVAGLSYLGVGTSSLDAFTRLLVWLLVFAILFGVSRLLSNIFSRNQRLVITGIIATISAIFLPVPVLLAAGAGFGTVVGLALVALPLVGLVFLLNAMGTSCPMYALKSLIALIFLWVVAAMQFHLTQLVNPGAVFSAVDDFIEWQVLIATLLLIYYLIRLLTCGGSSDGSGFLGLGSLFGGGRNSPSPGGGNGGDDDDDNGGGNGGDRPPGPVPPPTAPNANPHDPPTTEIPPSGFDPDGPEGPKPPKKPKKPKIPDRDVPEIIDLSPAFHGIRSQDGIGACAAFASTSMFEYVRTRSYGHGIEYLSPLFLYYKTREHQGTVNQDSGSISTVCLSSLRDDGVSKEDLWTFEGENTNKWRTAPSPPAEGDAVTKRIEGFYAVDRNDPDQWVYQLRDRNPLYISVQVPVDLVPGYSQKFYTNFNPTLRGGGHAMVIVGYHSHYPHNGQGIKAFKIRNSWGLNWGENGYTWIPAQTILRIMRRDPLVIEGWKGNDVPPRRDDPSPGAMNYKPVFGLWNVPPDEVATVVASAIRVGYTEFDTSDNYENQFELDDAIRSVSVKRVYTKLTPNHESIVFQDGLALATRLFSGADELIIMLHWPGYVDSSGVDYTRGDGLISYRQLAGQVNKPSVSNFGIVHLAEITKIKKPYLNQIEINPLLQQTEIIEYCKQHGILVQAFSPLASGRLNSDPTVVGIARQHGKTFAQVLIRYAYQKGADIVNVKTTNPERMRENRDINDFELSRDDMAALNALRDDDSFPFGTSGSAPSPQVFPPFPTSIGDRDITDLDVVDRVVENLDKIDAFAREENVWVGTELNFLAELGATFKTGGKGHPKSYLRHINRAERRVQQFQQKLMVDINLTIADLPPGRMKEAYEGLSTNLRTLSEILIPYAARGGRLSEAYDDWAVALQLAYDDPDDGSKQQSFASESSNFSEIITKTQRMARGLDVVLGELLNLRTRFGY